MVDLFKELKLDACYSTIILLRSVFLILRSVFLSCAVHLLSCAVLCELHHGGKLVRWDMFEC